MKFNQKRFFVRLVNGFYIGALLGIIAGLPLGVALLIWTASEPLK